jgi:hypothetical protein
MADGWEQNAMFVTGIVVSFDPATYTAVIEPAGSRQRRMADVPVSRAIDGAQMAAGRRVLVWAPAEGWSAEWCVAAVWV